jgi:CheY-like chemotaxis protein
MSSTVTDTATKRPLILIVDDCDESRDVLSVLLSSLDATIEQAGTGEEALANIDKLKPAVVLLDVNMPGISGFEVCEQLRANPDTRDITILFISALDDLESKIKGLSSGGVDYIAKPFDPDEVMARVSTQLELFNLRAKLLQRNNELEELVREKDRFLDLAAHGLRHPLLQVRGLVGLLRSGQLGEIGRQTLVNTIAQASEKMNQILSDVLEVHDLEAGTLELNPVSVSVTDIVQRCLNVWKHQADSKGVSIEARLDKTPGAVYDRDKLTQVLETVLAQAVTSCPERSSLNLDLESDETHFRLFIRGPDEHWLAAAYPGILATSVEFSAQNLSNSIVAKLVRHFEGSIQFRGRQLTLELPLDAGFSKDISNHRKG